MDRLTEGQRVLVSSYGLYNNSPIIGIRGTVLEDDGSYIEVRLDAGVLLGDGAQQKLSGAEMLFLRSELTSMVVTG